ncbi:MAG: CRISPR-associated endonuclease Cas2 [Anaerolineales bacterium]|nr:CRISPR-associated endonuclease Cas2 [Anaerolineales bacterium]
MFHVILIYDIECDRIRTKVATACLDYGLDRIQYSAFAGQLSRNHQEELMLRIRSLLTEGIAKVQLVRINTKDWDNRLEISYA